MRGIDIQRAMVYATTMFMAGWAAGQCPDTPDIPDPFKKAFEK
jgi:hypothetical protein